MGDVPSQVRLHLLGGDKVRYFLRFCCPIIVAAWERR
jgi:hypothetical protein